MRAVIQRVTRASVEIQHEIVSQIGRGLLVFLGIETADSRDDIVWLAGKIARLRVFSDENGAMNLSVQNIAGDLLIVSQFTLLASTRKGNRPSFGGAAAPVPAKPTAPATPSAAARPSPRLWTPDTDAMASGVPRDSG